MEKIQTPYEYIKGCLEDWIISQGKSIKKDSAHLVREVGYRVLEKAEDAEELYVLGWERCDYRKDIAFAMGQDYRGYSMLFYKGFLTAFKNEWVEGYDSGVYHLSMRPNIEFNYDTLFSLGEYLKENNITLTHFKDVVRLSYKALN